jgi:hypothetical protein
VKNAWPNTTTIGLEDGSRLLRTTLLMLVDNSNYATLDSIVWELVLVRMGWADPAHIHVHSTKLATPDHRLVYSLSILDAAPARCLYQRMVNNP